MGALVGVKIEKLQNGLNRKSPTTDGHIGMILAITAEALIPVVNNTGKGLVLTSLSQAEGLGLTESACVNAGDNWYEQISEFFRLAPDGTLYIFNSNVVANVTAWLKSNTEIKGFVITSTTATLDATAIAMQLLVNNLALENRLIDYVIIGVEGYTTAFAFNPSERSEPAVSILVAASSGSSYPAVGAYAGMISVRMVNENVGSVDILKKPLHKRVTADYSLTDSILELWTEPKLTGGELISALTGNQLKLMDTQGIIFASTYEGYPGAFFSNSKTCISASSDYCFIENNRVWNKAARAIRMSLLPEVKGVVKKDPSTGFIKSTTVSRWTGIANKALEQMVIDDEISGFEVYINPSQIVNSTAPVKVTSKVVMDGIVHEFEVALGLTNSIN